MPNPYRRLSPGSRWVSDMAQLEGVPAHSLEVGAPGEKGQFQ